MNTLSANDNFLSNQAIFNAGVCSLIPAVSHTLNAGGMGRCDLETETFIPAISPAEGGSEDGNVSMAFVSNAAGIRRLTPRECERLQGFPDEFTRIPYRGKPADRCPDGPRYKALGNSMAVNAIEWIGERINEVNRWQ